MDAITHTKAPPPWTKAQPISVAVEPVALVVTECITVTSAMRKHARWAHSSVSAILGGSAPSRLEILKAPPPTRKMPAPRKENGAPLPARSAQGPSDDSGLASRWGLRGKKGQSMQDNPLLSAFAKLRNDLKQCKDIHTVDAPAILHPFLQIIRSSSTSAPITSLALIAITKFFSYGIISQRSPQLPAAMQLLSSAVTHCRFEASDSATDEIVLFRILKLMEGMITGPGGEVLGDESMCEMMETGISMCCQVRLSELLRRSAEVSMVTMCQTIFQRLKILEIEPETSIPRRNSSKTESDAVKMKPSIVGDILGSEKNNGEGMPRPSEDSQASIASQESQQTEPRGRDSTTFQPPLDKGGGSDSNVVEETSQIRLTRTNSNGQQEIKPYALPSIRELFRVLVGLLDPHDRQHNDTMRVMALRIVDVALEVAGPSIANHPSLASLAKDTLCRHLFQLVRSENIVILNESLRVAGTLLSTCRRVLKLQQELFLSYLVACLHPRVEIPQEPGVNPALYEGVPQAPRLVKAAPTQPGNGRATPVPIRDRQRLGMEGGMRKPDAREAMVESVGALVRLPSFMPELFVNYDCEIDRSDLCLDMVGLLSRNAFPDAATWSTTNVPPLCLDALLGYIHSIAERIDGDAFPNDHTELIRLGEQRALKKVIIKGTSKFNESPKAGLAFLASQGIIKDLDDPNQVAAFLRGTSRLDKKILGDFISKRERTDLLIAFMETFDFTDLRVDEALRILLNSFRLPGESPLIERIVTEFANKYHGTSGTEDVADKDAVFVLTYAVIMLNTDQHNPNVKQQNRMNYTDFAKNLRGVNDGKDFEPEYLQDIYDSIKSREIILPEEHDNKNSFDHAWKELLFKIQSTTDMAVCDTNMFDADMFASTWKPVVATLSYVFMSATDDTVFSRIVTGFDQCAQIAAKYDLHEALDHIIFCLSSISTLATSTLPSTSLNTDVQAGEKSVMVSETAVRFGRDFKAQLATVVLFRVVVGNETAIREGWNHLVRILLNLFINSLLGSPYAAVSSNADLPPIPLQSPAQVIDRDRSADSGLFSAFTSYVSSFANDEPPEPSDQEIEYTLCTVDCVSACSFDTFFMNISRLPMEPLQAFLETLLKQLPEDNTPQVIVVKPEMPAPKPMRPNGEKARSVGLAYEPSMVFVLEFCTILAARDESTMAKFGKQISEALHAVVRDASHMHPVMLSRAVYYLLSFLRASQDHDFARAPVVLHAISKFDQELLKQAGPYVAKGLALCLRGPSGLRNEMVNSPDFWSILHNLHTVPDTAAEVFGMLQTLLDDASSTLTADNYDPILSLLNDFAAAGSIGAVAEQRRDQAAMLGKQASKKKTQSDAVRRGDKAVQSMYHMTARVPFLVRQSHLAPREAWSTYWPPLFRTLTTQGLNPCRQIRGQALSCLQRVLLSDALAIHTSSPDSKSLDVSRAISLFTEVIFPLIGQLLRPEIWQSDPSGMGETRLQAAVMCCKVFVKYLDTLFDADPIAVSTPASAPLSPAALNNEATNFPLPERSVQTDGTSPTSATRDSESSNSTNPGSDAATKIDGIRLWSHILQVLERLIKSGGQSDGLDEAIPESLKNVVLVMSSDGYLVPPPASAEGESRSSPQKRLWKVTFVRLERFQPGLMEAIFPGAGVSSPVQKAHAARSESASVEKSQEPADASKKETGEADADLQGQSTEDDAEKDDTVMVERAV